MKRVLNPFEQKILSKIGLEFKVGGTKKIGNKTIYDYYEYDIIDRESFEEFLKSILNKD